MRLRRNEEKLIEAQLRSENINYFQCFRENDSEVAGDDEKRSYKYTVWPESLSGWNV